MTEISFRDSFGKVWTVKALTLAEGRAYRFRKEAPPTLEARSPGGCIVRGVSAADLCHRANAMGRDAR